MLHVQPNDNLKAQWSRSLAFPQMVRTGPAVFWTLLWSAALAFHGFRGDVQTDLVIGRWILRHHAVPHHNWWSASAYGQPFSDTEWLFALGVAVVYDLGGRMAVFGAGVLTLAALSAILTVWLPPGRWRWVLIFAVGGLILPVLPPRPELVSYVGWAATLAAIGRFRATGDRRWLWITAGLTVVWTQMHMSVILVPLVLLGEWLWSAKPARRALTGPVLLSMVGTACRVGGPLTGGAFVGHVLSPAILTTVVEWMPPNPRTLWGLMVFGWCFFTWMQVGHRSWAQRDGRTLTWLVAGTFAVCFSQRMVPYTAIGFLLLWQPLLAEAPVGPPTARWRQWDNAVLAVGALIAVWLPVAQVGVFVPDWPPAVLALLTRDHATNIVAMDGDGLNGAGLLPWINGQVQLDAAKPWWPAWVETFQAQASPATFVARYDPTSHWIVWPLDSRRGFGPLTLPAPWHKVWQGPMRWGGLPKAEPTAVWTR